MDEKRIEILAPGDVRRALTRTGDVRSDVAFQNDVNALLARFEQMAIPWRALSDTTPTEPSRPIITDATPAPRVMEVRPANAEAPRMGLPTPRRTRTLDGIGLAPLVVKNPRRAART
ncbi:MAG TPA: hypothetical protein VHJ20_22450 [Polyangia bacterium]|nr:hypothetical protein [Polyangia bacterium]